MKTNLILSACLALLFTGCTKDKGHNDVNSDYTWVLGQKGHKAVRIAFVAGSNTDLIAYEGDPAAPDDWISFWFQTPPADGGHMLITDSFDINTVSIEAHTLKNDVPARYSHGPTNVYLDVTLKDGKVSVHFPGSIWMHNDYDYSDSLQLSIGNITEQ